MKKSFYIAAITGVLTHILTSLYTVYTLFDFQLFQKQIIPYLILSTVVLLFNSFVIVRYCWHKKYWWALIGFVLSSALTLIDILDTSFFFLGKGQQIVLKDPTAHWYVSIICTTIHFLLILLSQARKVRWFTVYALTGLALSLTLSFVNQTQNSIIYTITLLLYCTIPICLILIYWNEIRKLNTSENDEILDAS